MYNLTKTGVDMEFSCTDCDETSSDLSLGNVWFGNSPGNSSGAVCGTDGVYECSFQAEL